MTKKLAIAATALIALVVILGTTAPSMATKDDNNGKALGCVNANENSKAGQQNPHCGADLQITGPTDLYYSIFKLPRVAVFQVTVTNNGPQTAENVVVTADTVYCTANSNGVTSDKGCSVTPDDYTWDGTLAAGASTTFTVSVIHPSDGTTITTSVSSTTHDPDPTNNVLVTTIHIARPHR